MRSLALSLLCLLGAVTAEDVVSANSFPKTVSANNCNHIAGTYVWATQVHGDAAGFETDKWNCISTVGLLEIQANCAATILFQWDYPASEEDSIYRSTATPVPSDPSQFFVSLWIFQIGPNRKITFTQFREKDWHVYECEWDGEAFYRTPKYELSESFPPDEGRKTVRAKPGGSSSNLVNTTTKFEERPTTLTKRVIGAFGEVRDLAASLQGNRKVPTPILFNEDEVSADSITVSVGNGCKGLAGTWIGSQLSHGDPGNDDINCVGTVGRITVFEGCTYSMQFSTRSPLIGSSRNTQICCYEKTGRVEVATPATGWFDNLYALLFGTESYPIGMTFSVTSGLGGTKELHTNLINWLGICEYDGSWEWSSRTPNPTVCPAQNPEGCPLLFQDIIWGE